LKRSFPDSAERDRSPFHGGGEMGRLMASFDWSRTPLGPVERWPQSLKTAVRILLTSRFEMWMAWGPGLPFLYNDAYLRKTIGKKHPRALGMPTRELWSEIWQDIGPRIEHVLTTGEATWDEALLLFLERSGYPEETYHTFSYSPLADDQGRIAGMLSVVTEQTEGVIGERRLRTLRDLAAQLASANGQEAIFHSVARSLSANGKDLPFTLTYLFEDDGRTARLASATRIEAGHPAAPSAFAIGDEAAPWPAAALHARATPILVEDLARRFPALPSGDWPRPPERALVVPIAQSGAAAPAGFLVSALNPFRPLDESYGGFLNLIAGQVAASLANARAYEQERKRAEALAELDRAKTVFFGNVSHEFRTPLTLMLGPLEDALASPARALSGPDLEAAHRNALRLLRLVNGLLDFSRIEAGRVAAVYRPTDLAARTADLASQFRSAIERGGLRLAVRCAPIGEPVYVDLEMWEKIVLNLLSNAFKFTHRGEIEVALEREGDEAVFLVRDTGIGIPAAELPRLFERFHRVEGARGRSLEGSGIGLALVQELVRLHGGRIEASSELERGTEFRVRLRLGRAHLPPDKVREDAPALAGSGVSAFVEEALQWASAVEPVAAQDLAIDSRDRGARIVLAEDNADMRDYVRRLLGATWSVTAVADGREALEAIRRDRPALVITDVMMPRLDGFGLLKALRDAPETRGIPVLMLSARAGEEARIGGLQAGADDYIVKPFSAREFVARIAAHLQLSRLRERLQSEQAAMAALFEQTPMPIAVMRGPELVFELANPPYHEVTGNRPLVGRPLLGALPELTGRGFDELLREVMRTGKPYIGREHMAPIRRGGAIQETYWTFIYAPLRGVSGENDGVVIIANEVTEQVLARRRQDQLIRDAAQASRAKDEFLAMLGHELRNPLSPIVTALQLLRLRGVQAQEHEVIERQVGHLTRLVDDLLDVSRITQGKVVLRRARVELAEIVARAVETASPLLEQRHNRLDVRIPGRGLEVDADLDRMAQVLSNLLTNAAKYSDEHSRIELFAERHGEAIRVHVKDYGSGIAPDMLDRIWDLFVQQPQSMERSVGGLGLGLSIVRSLVRLHGGKVWATSAGPGKGSQFTVELAAAVPASPAEEPRPRPPQRPTAAPVPRRILVVDDNRDAAGTLALALTQVGHTVQLAHDGPSALEAAEQLDAEIALIDIGLPVMDGYELARRLRESPRAPMQLIAITGYGQESDRRRSAAAGFARHLVKPVDLGQLLDAIANLQ
jgi:signal transduction histidine kinase